MNRQELEHIIAASSKITGEAEFVIIGSQSILGKCPDAPRVLRESMECDIYPKFRPEKSEMIDGAIGELSQFHKTFQYHAHGIGPETAIVPLNWENRLIPVKSPSTNGATGWCLDPHDLAYSKLAAGRPKDLEFVTQMKRHEIIRPSLLERSIEQTLNQELQDLLKMRWSLVKTRLSRSI
jgi:hypothetical protein